MAGRYELSDAQWQWIAHLLSANPATGGARVPTTDWRASR